mgnify:CR=1 FL=1
MNIHKFLPANAWFMGRMALATVAMLELVEKKYTPKFRGWVLEPHGDQKRIVTLRPGEGLSRSILLQDQPWYDEVVEMLEATGFTKYRITPHARVFVFDEAGNRHCDRASAGTYNYPMSPREPNDFRLTRYPVPGASFDLELVKKLQAMKTKGAASRLNEPKRQGGAEAAPPSPLE